MNENVILICYEIQITLSNQKVLKIIAKIYDISVCDALIYTNKINNDYDYV